MLRLYPLLLDWLSSLPPVLSSISARDPHLADQLRRSSTSVVLNVAEGLGAAGRSKTQCYRIALREMRESLAAIDIATRLRYVDAVTPDSADRQDRIVGTLVRLARPGR